MKKIFLSFLFIVSLSFSFISCDPSFPYKGERYDLLSEIINKIKDENSFELAQTLFGGRLPQ